jgi:hypothetical protein
VDDERKEKQENRYKVIADSCQLCEWNDDEKTAWTLIFLIEKIQNFSFCSEGRGGRLP